MTARIDKIFQRFEEKQPNPQIELNYTNPFTLLIAVVLSAQSTDVGVNKATESLFKIISSPQDVLNMGEDEFKSYVKTINLYPTKSRNILATSKILVEKHHSQVPDSLAKLITLPGVGLKSAKVILNSAFNKPYIGVDTHVFRVSRRIGLTHQETPEKVSADLESIIPEKWKLRSHHWLVLHGRYICKARKPLCESCIISDMCEYYALQNLVKP